ncbi:hypothetical protein [Olivibacter jilunii]|uniref:hypothetical protein n=1 Tax=Olivibacter jilunii TaxID=985016 RepID=UPI00103112DD|nr:hypothetical protein [Olivibacter jilunii]
MKRITLIRVVVTLFVTVIFMHACSKKELPSQFPGSSEEDATALIKEKYEALNLQAKLTTPFKDSLTMTWSPDWQSTSNKKAGDTAVYYYIPINPYLTVPSGAITPVQAVNLQQFIVVKRLLSQADKFVFYRATYSAEVDSLSGSPTSPIGNFDRFTGWLVLDDFSGHRTLHRYQNGQLVTENSGNKNASENARWICDQECSWFSYCTGADIGNGNYTVTTTYGRAGNSCDYPWTPLPDCGFAGAQPVPWTLTSSSEVNCTYIDDGVPPTPPDGGGGTGGSIEEEMAQFDENIKDSLTSFCLRSALEGIKNLKDGKIAEIITKFSGQVPNWNWTVKEGPLGPNINGITTLITGGALTTIDFSKFQNATTLAMARTMMHEAVHAYLTVYFRYDPLNAQKDYPGMVKAWSQSKHPDYADIQHDQMVKSFVGDIAKALEDYGIACGYSIDSYIYNDLAWGGLDFMNNSQLSDTDKERIQNRLSAEQTGTVYGDEAPAGLKCKPPIKL